MESNVLANPGILEGLGIKSVVIEKAQPDYKAVAADAAAVDVVMGAGSSGHGTKIQSVYPPNILSYCAECGVGMDRIDYLCDTCRS